MQPPLPLQAVRRIYFQRLQPDLFIEGETRQLCYDVLVGDIRSKPFKLAKVQVDVWEYGENFILCQYLPYAWDLISLCKKRLSPNLEGGLTGCVTMIHHMIPYLNDGDMCLPTPERRAHLLLAKGFQLLLVPCWSSSNFPDTRPDPPESFQAPAESLRSHVPSAATKV